jgi:hypothetical protein
MEYIWNALSGAMLAYIWIDVIGVDILIKKWTNTHDLTRIKPFDCRLCLSFWFGAMFGATDPLTALQTGLIAVLVERLMYRLEI